MTKSIVITGGSQGIGRAAADALAASGWAVIGVARYTPAGFPGQCITADLSDFERTAEVATELTQRGDVLGIVNNVGAAKHERFGSIDPSAFFEVMKGNTKAALQLTQAPVSTMRKARFGSIINITSLVTRGLPSDRRIGKAHGMCAPPRPSALRPPRWHGPQPGGARGSATGAGAGQASQDGGEEGCPLTWAPSADAVAGARRRGALGGQPRDGRRRTAGGG